MRGGRQNAVQPPVDKLRFETMVGRIDVAQSEISVAVNAGGHLLDVGSDAVGIKLRIVVELKSVRCRSGKFIGAPDEAEIAVKAALGAYHRARGKRRHYVGKIELPQESGNQMFDGVWETAPPLLRSSHGEDALAGAAQEVVVDKSAN